MTTTLNDKNKHTHNDKYLVESSDSDSLSLNYNIKSHKSNKSSKSHHKKIITSSHADIEIKKDKKKDKKKDNKDKKHKKNKKTKEIKENKEKIIKANKFEISDDSDSDSYSVDKIKIKKKDKSNNNINFNSDVNKKEKIDKSENYYKEKKISSVLEYDFGGGTIVEKKDVPKKYGSKWTDNDKNRLIDMLKNSSKIIVNLDDNKADIFEYSPNSNTEGDALIREIAKKLDRTEGGIRAEIKKVIFDKYTRGETIEKISETLNLTYKNVKSTIKIQLDKECDNEILILEKENKLLSLKIENKKLKKKIEALSKV